MEDSDTTWEFQISATRSFQRTGWDLLNAADTRLPVCYREVFLGGASPEAAVLSNDLELEGLPPRAACLDCSGDTPVALALDDKVMVQVNGQAVKRSPLREGDVLEVGSHRLRLARSELVAVLEALNPGSRGRLWGLTASHATLGRRGKRKNSVELEHRSVSREHATLRWDQEQFWLQAETSASATMVNGEAVGTRPLRDGDVLQLGEMVLRLRLFAESAGLRLWSLGPFQVQLRGEKIADKAWRGQVVRHLLAYLAGEWGHPVSVDLLLEQFWPDLQVERARNNLNSAMSTLRGVLKGSEGSEWLTRTHQTLQLVPHEQDWHDYIELKQALEQGEQSPPEAQAGFDRRALELYRGPYLEGCFMDWALRRRDQLERDLVAVALRLAGHLASRGEHEQAIWSCRKALTWDPCCQEAYLRSMQSCRAAGRAEEAVRLFEACKSTLHRELGMEPSLELLREHQLSILSLG